MKINFDKWLIIGLITSILSIIIGYTIGYILWAIFIPTQDYNLSTDEQLRATVSDYIDYYNNERGQWNLKKLPPVHYREQFLSGIA
ncbi:IS3 family transposase [Marinilactibacillus psychrotolerans]|uniref:IS3 family transposase n=1 Tax=Marinilactibacillus psychrotolerans TaxID=191770 RepID=UPI00388B2AAD